MKKFNYKKFDQNFLICEIYTYKNSITWSKLFLEVVVSGVFKPCFKESEVFQMFNLDILEDMLPILNIKM